MKIKKLIAIFSLLLLYSFDSYTQTKHHLNTFDSVQNLEQLNNALIKIDPKLKSYCRVPLKDVKLFYDKTTHFYNKISDSLGIMQPFEFIDIDHNGYTDVLLSQQSEDFGPFFILMFPKNKYQIFDLNIDNKETLGFGKIQKHNIETPLLNLILLRQGFELSDYHRRFFPGFESLELVYKFDNFLEYNPNPISDSFKQIDFMEPKDRVGQQEGISILENGNMKMFKTAMLRDTSTDNYLVKTNYYKAQIDPKDQKFLFELINYINISKLKSHYIIPGVRDDVEILLHVITNSIDKTIRDYGMSSSFGLKILYHKLGEIMEHTNWQLDNNSL